MLTESLYVKGDRSLEVGDVIAIDGFLTRDDRQLVREIRWHAGSIRNVLEPLTVIIFPNAQNVDGARELGSELGRERFESAARCQTLEPVKSYLATREAPLADVSEFGLPNEYVAIHPFSGNNAGDLSRNLDRADQLAVLDYLRRGKLPGVVVNTSKFFDALWLPGHDCVTDLTGRTNLLQALEIVRRASGFIGCGSCHSVMAAAATTIEPDKIFIRGNAELREKRHHFFYPRLGGKRVFGTIVEALSRA